MTSSRERSDQGVLDFQLPTTSTDVAALRRARRQKALSLSEALAVLSRIDLGPGRDTSRRTAAGWKAFSLD